MPYTIKPYINLFDKSFKASQTRSYKMSVSFDMTRLTLSLYHPEKNKHLALLSYHADDVDTLEKIPGFFDKILNSLEWFGFPFQEVNVLYKSRLNTLIPAALFDPEHKNLYLGFNQPFQENNRIVYDKLSTTEAINVYYIPNPFVEKVKDLWPNARISHYASGYIESLTIGFKNKMDNRSLYLNADNSSFNLVYFKDNKLHYHNQFSYRTKEDFVYFLLAAMEQLSLNPEEVRLVLMGDIDKSSNTYELLYRYVRHMSFLERNEAFGYSYALDDLLHHHYYTLFNIQQCEL